MFVHNVFIDIYVSINSFPTLDVHSYANTDCDPCGETDHIIDIFPDKLVPLVGSLDRSSKFPDPSTKNISVVVGIFGYCCVDTQFTVEVFSGPPEGLRGILPTERPEFEGETYPNRSGICGVLRALPARGVLRAVHLLRAVHIRVTDMIPLPCSLCPAPPPRRPVLVRALHARCMHLVRAFQARNAHHVPS
jgi:hypothetical protein